MSGHLARLARGPRPAGGAAAERARAYCADVLGSLGFAIGERSFEYSKVSGAWAAPFAGLLVPVMATVAYLLRNAPWIAFSAVAGAVTVFLVTVTYFSGPGVLGAPFMRRRGVNLEAVRGNDEPTVWLVAHVDSKWQPVSMVVRVLGVIVTLIGLVLLLLSAYLAPTVAPAFLAMVWLGAIPLMLSVVGDKSDGAVDNASGVATVLEAAALIPPTSRIGVLITDAEELALAGARAWARSRTPAIALNVDSVDDQGSLVVMHSGSLPRPLVSAIRKAAADEGEPLMAFRLIPGILTDSVALAAAGWATVTLSRGTIRTLQRIHTSRDSLAHMDGRGVPGAARVLARAATELA